MPRKEMEQAYVPRVEHAQQKANQTEWSVKIFLAIIAVGQLATAVYLAANNS